MSKDQKDQPLPTDTDLRIPLTPNQTADVEQRFRELAATRKKETRHLSVIRRMTAHPAYREIVAMGKAAVPLLLAELRRRPDHWFTALQEITGIDPVPPASRGDVAEMARAWVAWGEAEGFQP